MFKDLLSGKKKASFVDTMHEGFFTGFDFARQNPDMSRQEAEMLVEAVIDHLRTLDDGDLQRIVDVANK